MLISRQERESLNEILEITKLRNNGSKTSPDKDCKIEQIVTYLEAIHADLRKYSKQRRLVLVDCGAGNSYLSFLVYFYYTRMKQQDVAIHCVDVNERLMAKCRATADSMGFRQMFFHACDIRDFNISEKVHMVYALHACDTATDKTLHFGAKKNVPTILSASCCQHSIKRHIRNKRYHGITKHSVFKDKFVTMVGDSMRGLLLEMLGYKVSIFEFVSSRYTDKNIMLRAKKTTRGRTDALVAEYERLKSEFNVSPSLEGYLFPDGNRQSA